MKKEEFYEIKTILETNGFVCQAQDVSQARLNQVEHIVFRNEKGFTVEVHLNIMGNRSHLRSEMGDCFQNVFDRTQTISVRDVELTIMNQEDHYVYLIMHAFKHFIECGVGVRQILDILIFQKFLDKGFDWSKLQDILKQYHLDKFLGDIQCIGTQYLGFKFESILPSCSPEELLCDVIQAGAFGKKDKAALLAVNITTGEL